MLAHTDAATPTPPTGPHSTGAPSVDQITNVDAATPIDPDTRGDDSFFATIIAVSVAADVLLVLVVLWNRRWRSVAPTMEANGGLQPVELQMSLGKVPGAALDPVLDDAATEPRPRQSGGGTHPVPDEAVAAPNSVCKVGS